MAVRTTTSLTNIRKIEGAFVTSLWLACVDCQSTEPHFYVWLVMRGSNASDKPLLENGCHLQIWEYEHVAHHLQYQPRGKSDGQMTAGRDSGQNGA